MLMLNIPKHFLRQKRKFISAFDAPKEVFEKFLTFFQKPLAKSELLWYNILSC